MKRDHLVGVRVTDKEWKVLEKKAAAASLSVSTYVRNLLLPFLGGAS